MLRTALFSICLLTSVSALPQDQDLAHLNRLEAGATSTSERQFQFELPANLSFTTGEAETHFLGQEVAEKWAYINSIYIRRQEVEVGFGASYTETYKPSVFNAVSRLNRHYRKLVDKHPDSSITARAAFIHVLNCAIAVYFEEETQTLENALSGARKPEDILAVFQQIELIQP